MKVILVSAALFISCLSVGAIQAAEPISETTTLGPVEATVRMEPSEPRIGDVVTLTLEVQAEAGVEVLMPEFGEALERYAIVDFVPRRAIDDAGRTIDTQQYRLQPPSSGIQAIPPILVEFVDRRPGQREAPEGQDAYELLTERIEFVVQSVIPHDAAADLKPPLGELPPLQSGAAPRRIRLLVVLVALAVIAALILVGWTSWRRRARKRSAYQIARARFDRLAAAARPTSETVGVFYVELSSIVRRYLEDRFDLRAPELTTEEFLELASNSPDLTVDHQHILREFLRLADLVKFANVVPSADDIQQSLDTVLRFLEETRQDAPLVDDANGDVLPSRTHARNPQQIRKNRAI